LHTFSTLQHGPVSGFQFGYSPLPRLIRPVPVWCYRLHNTLIDTASRHCQRQVLQALADQPIEQILLTHFHEDHSANASALRQRHGCVVRAGQLTAQRVVQPFRLLPYEQFWFGRIDACPGVLPWSDAPKPIPVGPYQLRPVPTLGHADDHHVLHEANEGWLFAGDFYIGNLKIFRRGENIYQQIDACRQVLTLDFDTLFCGHNPVLVNGKAAVLRKLHYLENIVERVLAAHRRGVSGAGLLRAAGLREQPFYKWFTSGDVSASHLVESVLTHSLAV
jgi:glyoxylase-like metal-dependent hydrolase (beta-lactamase superfamily II)